MNTIPSIFNQRQVNVTVLGGKEKIPEVKIRMGVILLNRSGSHYRMQVIENLVRIGFESIVSIEKNPDNYNIAEFSHSFPFVKFIVPLEEVTDGECINIGMSETESDFVLVLRDSLNLSSEIINPRVAGMIIEDNAFCTVPRLLKQGNVSFPIVFSPYVRKSRFEVNSSSTVTEGIPTLFPFDNIAVYNRKKFIQLGGYDYTIKNRYYQNLDFSMRAWLWGEKITVSTVFNLYYLNDPPVEDASPSLDSSRFYLKNLLPHFINDHGAIKRSGFLVFLPRSSCGFFEALRQFSEARQWVWKNRYRFKIDAAFLLENWGIIK
ncbi:MAG: hypothetical protein J6Y93_04275 [Treponema sp.]|nr:hypothetical protein [Treponema sp.]